MAINKILIIRFSSIGDIVLTSPVIRCLAQQFPTATLHFATKKSYADLLSNNPYLQKVHSFEGSIFTFIKSLETEEYDFIVDLHRNQRTWLIKRMLNKPSASFSKLNLAKWWLVRTKRNLLPDKHIVDRYFEAVQSLGVTNDNRGLDFFIRPEAASELNALQNSFPSNYTAIVLGATYATKAIPLAKLIELIPLLQKVVLVGGKNEQSAGEQLYNQFPHQVINLAGKLSIDGSALVMQGASAVITPDTGMMHIAAALKKPIISVWGSTVPAFGMYPYRPDNPSGFAIIENPALSCRPCSKLGYNSCPKGHFSCMIDLPATSIAEAATAVTS